MTSTSMTTYFPSGYLQAEVCYLLRRFRLHSDESLSSHLGPRLHLNYYSSLLCLIYLRDVSCLGSAL